MFELEIDFKEDGNVYTVTAYPKDKLDALAKLEEHKKQHKVIHATLMNPRTKESIVIWNHTDAAA